MAPILNPSDFKPNKTPEICVISKNNRSIPNRITQAIPWNKLKSNVNSKSNFSITDEVASRPYVKTSVNKYVCTVPWMEVIGKSPA